MLVSLHAGIAFLAFILSLIATEGRAVEPADRSAAALKPIANADDPLSRELSEEEIAHVDEIVEEVHRLWKANPHAPLPADSKSLPAPERTRRYNAWIESLYLEAWRAHGKHDPRWDDEVESLLADVARPEGEKPAKRQITARARKLLDQGCDDPLVRYALAISLDLDAGTAVYQVVDALRPALEKLGPEYAPAIAYRIELRYVQAWERAHRNRVQEAAPILERLIGRMVGILSAPLSDEERRRHLQRMTSALERELKPHSKLFFQKLAAVEADRWMVQMLLARAHVNLGWAERGGGFAGDVTQPGWRGFGAHLAKARSLLLQAWHERPDLPEAAHDQIAVTMGSGGVAGEDPRFWFDRAVAADFDLRTAYFAMMWALRPRWGGSHEEMLNFGRECLATKRFDTTVPWFFHRAVCDILSESADPREAFQELDAYDDYVALLDGSRPHAKNNEPVRRDLDTTMACVAWLAGHDEEARRLLKGLGDDVSLKAIGDLHITLSDMRLALSDAPGRAPPGERWLHAGVDRLRFVPEAKWLIGFGTFTGLVAFDMSGNGQPVFDLPRKIDGQLMRDIDISPDGDLLALILMSDGDDQTKTGSVVLWDVPGAKIRSTLPLASKRKAYRVRFSPNGKWLAAGMLDGSVTVWNVETGERPAWGHWRAHRAWVEALAFTADGKHLATAAADWKVMLWNLPDPDDDAAKPPTATATWGPFAAPPVSVAFSPDGRRLLIGHDYCEVWDVDEGKLIRELPGSQVAYAPDGKTIATGGGEIIGEARVWDAESGAQRARLIGGHRYSLTSLLYSPNGKRIVSGSADPSCEGEGVIRCWNAETGEEVFDFSGCCGQ